MTVEAKKLTYEDYLALPEMEQPYEIIDGELTMTPAPAVKHQWVLANLTRLLDGHVRSRKLGMLLFSPLDVLICRDPLCTRQPDLLFISTERQKAGGEDVLEMQALEVAPDLVIEILSPGNTRRDVVDKLEDYRSIGVGEAWLVSPEAQTIEVTSLLPEGMEVAGLFGAGMTIHSEVLPDFALSVNEVFAQTAFTG